MDEQHDCEQSEFCTAAFTADDGKVYCCDCGGFCYDPDEE